MPFSIRPFHRFRVCCPVTYRCGLFEGQGTMWNLSLAGWRFSGNLPLRVGEVCSLTGNLPIQETIYVAAGIVRWVRGDEEYAVETLVIDDESGEDVAQYLWQRVGESFERIPMSNDRPKRETMTIEEATISNMWELAASGGGGDVGP